MRAPDTSKLAYTADEAAQAIGLSRDTILRAIRSGDLKAKRSSKDDKGNPAGRHLIPAKALADYLDGMTDA